MASIEIKDSANVINSAETLATQTVKMDSARESIQAILTELGQYWSQTQQDAQTFSKELQQNVEKMGTIVECNAYAESQQKTSTQAVTIS